MSTHMRYIDTLLEEKGIDLDQTFEAISSTGIWNLMTYRVVIDHIRIAPTHEQAGIADILRRIDFMNGDVRHYLRHLGAAIAR